MDAMETVTALADTEPAALGQRATRGAPIPFYDRLAWPVREFAAGAGVSVAFLYLEIGRGRLRLTKRGRRSLILREDGLLWLNSGRDQAA